MRSPPTCCARSTRWRSTSPPTWAGPVLDEPTIGLDVLSRQAVRGFVAELAATGDTTVVLTTHDLADIERLARRLVVIDHGRVVHDGSLESLRRRYGSTRTVVAELTEPLTRPVTLPGVRLVASEADGHRLTFALEEGHCRRAGRRTRPGRVAAGRVGGGAEHRGGRLPALHGPTGPAGHPAGGRRADCGQTGSPRCTRGCGIRVRRSWNARRSA